MHGNSNGKEGACKIFNDVVEHHADIYSGGKNVLVAKQS
jgi:hypothetical protein